MRSFLPSGSNARMSARRFSRLVVVDVRPRADRDVQGLAVGRELQVARPVPAAADPLVAAGDVLDDRLRLARAPSCRRSCRGSGPRVGVADVDVLRLRPERVEGDPERSVQAGGEDLVDLGLAVAVGVAEDADAVGAALGQEQVAVRRGAITRGGSTSPVANSVTLNPCGAVGQAPSGRWNDPRLVHRRFRGRGGGKVRKRNPMHVPGRSSCTSSNTGGFEPCWPCSLDRYAATTVSVETDTPAATSPVGHLWL